MLIARTEQESGFGTKSKAGGFGYFSLLMDIHECIFRCLSKTDSTELIL